MFYLLAFDSRGKELENSIRQCYEGNFHILIEPGGNIRRVTDAVKEAIKYMPYTHALLQVGVNELTTKIGTSLVCNYNTTSEIVEDLTAKLLVAKREIMETRPAVKVVISPIVGVSLSMYNEEAWHHQEQDLINDAIIKINCWIKHENGRLGLETPMLDRKIHKQQGKGRKSVHRYSKLATDGLHLSDPIKDDWVQEIVRVMRHFDL